MKNIEKDKESILVITVGILILYWWKRYDFLLYAAIVVGVLGLASSNVRSWIVFGWNKLALGLGYVNSRILLSIVFYLFLTPTALLRRLLTKPVHKAQNSTSFFKDRNHTYVPQDFEHPW